MARLDDGGPAFARPASEDRQSTLHDGNVVEESQEDMSLRDWFAGHAALGLMLRSPNLVARQVAAEAYSLADAMLMARKAVANG
jgi:hypothetical protein